MNTLAIIEAITKSIGIISETQKKEGDEAAEHYLRRMQLLLNRVRPLTLHTEN